MKHAKFFLRLISFFKFVSTGQSPRLGLANQSLSRIARLRHRGPRPFADYANWLRRAPGKTLCDHLLNDATADLWHRHLAGEDHTAILGRHLTLKLYFRQLFDNKYRTLEEAEELLKET